MLKIELKEITIREIVDGYKDHGIDGVVAYGGKLNVRPAYQREFVYNDEQQKAVMDSILQGYPLNVMYWCENEDGTYEVLDGQQRTLSFCKFHDNQYSIIHNNVLRQWHSMPYDIQEQILNYKCMIYVCRGTDTEKLNWFKVINTAGEVLYEQELRNACYTGTWLTDAKRYFSKNNCAAYAIGNKLISGHVNRQDYLERALDWIKDAQGMKKIEEYMLLHQHDPNALELWTYYTSVINWVNALFPKYRVPMKGLKWGLLYNKFHHIMYDPVELEEEVKKLMADDEVQDKKGIYTYVFTHDEKYLNLRAFTDTEKMTMYERQEGICPICKEYFLIEQMEGDHITPWVEGGKTTIDNGQMLCRNCNRRKSSH